MERGAAAAVLAVVGVGSRLNKSCRNVESLRLVRFALAGGDLVQAAIEVPLGAACARRERGKCESCARTA